MPAVIHDLSFIYSLALSPFGHLLYTGPGLRGSWIGYLSSWTKQSRQWGHSVMWGKMAEVCEPRGCVPSLGHPFR